MSLRMSFCMRAIKTLADNDLSVITDGIEAYVRGGMDTTAAERAAVNDLLFQVRAERDELMALAIKQHPDLGEQEAKPARAAPESAAPTTPGDGNGQAEEGRRQEVLSPAGPEKNTGPAPASASEGVRSKARQGPVMRRSATAAAQQAAQRVQDVVDAVTSRWANAPDVIVLNDFSEASPAAQQVDREARAQGGDGATQGYWEGGKVYLVASELRTDADVVRVLFHETIGHAGLRGAFGKRLAPILEDVASANPIRMRRKAAQYGLDLADRDQRLTVAEEILAEMAERTPTATAVQRFIAAVRQFLREIGVKVELSDNDIVVNFLTPAREFITTGRSKPGRGAPARSAGPTESDGSDIRFSRGTLESIRAGLRGFDQAAARNLFLDATANAGKLGLWARTIGTQYAKAQRHPETFGRVFNAVQDYIKDISSFANTAADRAPNILPKLERWRDLGRGGLTRLQDAKPEDLKAAGAAIFQGTLNWTRDADGKLVEADDAGSAGVVFTAAELRSKFGLTGPQIDLYREFRAAVDQSLDDLAKSEMLRMAGSDGAEVAREVLVAPSLTDAAAALRKHFDALISRQQDRANGLNKTFEAVAEKADQVENLKGRGYAPLMRFGRHTLHITSKDGETIFFGMYESRRDANRAAREMQADPQFRGAKFGRGLMSQEAYRLYSGMPLDALELFASATGNADNEVYQDFLRLTKSNRSALKRMIHRQGIAGFSEDTSRVLASFVTSNARLASGNLHLGVAKAAADAIPKEQGDLKDDAVRLVQYVQDPQEEAAGIRGLLFANFIGGSVASAAVNLTQPVTMALPYLSQWGGAVKAGQHLLAAARIAAGGKAEGEIGEALARAERDGIVSPQEIHHLQAEAMSRLGSHPVLKKAAFIWGGLFSLSEQFNRRVSFIAAYNTAKEQHIENPFAFAERAVIETQGLYNKGNKANWARGPIGATAMTFKQFSIHYLEFLQRMWASGPQGRRAVAVALAVLVLTAGAGGLPFADDLDDAVDTLAQALGYDFSSKAAKRRFVAETLGLGNVAADVATRGLSSIPGWPIDVSMRMGMGNLLPGTGALLRSNTDRSADVLEFAGAAGGMAKGAMDAGTKLLSGEVAKAGLTMVPVAVQNMATALSMWNTGEYRNRRDQKVIETGPVDAAMKFIGFQPADVARESMAMREVQRSVQLVKNVESEIAAKWARGLNDNDPEVVAEARQDLADWNRRNPDTQMRITMNQVIQRVREMRRSRAERAVQAAPAELRQRVREAL